MKQGFITSKGKIEIDRNTLYIKNRKYYIEESVLGRLFIPFVFLLLSALKFILPEKPLDYFGGAIFGILFLFYTDRVYDVVVKCSIANRIPLDRIHSYEIKPDSLGLETEVILHLKNGRYRSIPFRTLEKQYEPFAELVSQYIAQPQLA